MGNRPESDIQVSPRDDDYAETVPDESGFTPNFGATGSTKRDNPPTHQRPSVCLEVK